MHWQHSKHIKRCVVYISVFHTTEHKSLLTCEELAARMLSSSVRTTWQIMHSSPASDSASEEIRSDNIDRWWQLSWHIEYIHFSFDTIMKSLTLLWLSCYSPMTAFDYTEYIWVGGLIYKQSWHIHLSWRIMGICQW